MDLPLLIGGATTSRQHTAVRIAPAYTHPTVHVLDASRVVGVVSALLDPERKATLDGENRALQDAAARAARGAHEDAAAPLPQGDRAPHADRVARGGPRRARLHGHADRGADHRGRCAPYIDWTFFFTAWELKGRFPAILDHPRHGAAARELYEHAQELLDQIVARRARSRRAASSASGPRTPRATTSCWTNGVTFPMLRQQTDHGAPERRPTEPVARGLRGARRDGPHRPPRRLRRHGGDRRRRAREGVRGRPRRLPRHHGQGARRPPRRGVRRVPAPAGADRVGLPGGAAAQRGAGPRALPRHPARVRLPRLSRPLAEAAALRPPGRPRAGHRPDGDVLDDRRPPA